MSEITLEAYEGSVIQNSFVKSVPSLKLEDIEREIDYNFNKGLIDEELFNKAKDELNILIEAVENYGGDIEKAFKNSHSQGGQLVLTHIINKNGKHQVVWKKPGEVHPDESKHLREVKEGDTVNYKDEQHKVLGIGKSGYIKLKDSSGRVHDKSPNKVEFNKPEDVDLKSEDKRVENKSDKKVVDKKVEEPKKEESKVVEPKKEEPKQVEDKLKDYRNLDAKEYVNDLIKFRNARERVKEKHGIKYNHQIDKDSSGYIGDEKFNNFKNDLDKEHTKKYSLPSFSETLNLSNVNVEVLPELDRSYLESVEKEGFGGQNSYNLHKLENLDNIINFFEKKERFLHQIDNFGKRNNLRMYIPNNHINTPNGKSGEFQIRFWSPEDRDIKFDVKASVDRNGNVDFHSLNSNLKHLSKNARDSGEVKSHKMMNKFSNEFNPDHIDSENDIDENWIKLKDKYENYYSGRNEFSHISKVDDNTIHFTAGDVGKKQNYQDTVNSAFSLTPPKEIGDYKLVSGDDVFVNGKTVSKKEMKEHYKKQGNDYSEYENNVSLTYVYKKK